MPFFGQIYWDKFYSSSPSLLFIKLSTSLERMSYLTNRPPPPNTHTHQTPFFMSYNNGEKCLYFIFHNLLGILKENIAFRSKTYTLFVHPFVLREVPDGAHWGYLGRLSGETYRIKFLSLVFSWSSECKQWIASVSSRSSLGANKCHFDPPYGASVGGSVQDKISVILFLELTIVPSTILYSFLAFLSSGK